MERDGGPDEAAVGRQFEQLRALLVGDGARRLSRRAARAKATARAARAHARRTRAESTRLRRECHTATR